MFIVIKDDNILVKKSLKQINQKLKTAFTKEDFKNYNSNYILKLTDSDLDYKRDIFELNKVFVNKLYKKDNSNLINYAFFIIILLILLITLTSVSGMSEMISQLIEPAKQGGLLLK